MILDRIQHYLGIIFFTTLVLTQALIFVAVSASNNDETLPVVFVEPISENMNIGDSVYFQAMISDQEDQQYDLVYFNLKNFATGLDENYQASLVDDGTWTAQNIWDTDDAYQPGQYYLSVVAHENLGDLPVDIYYSQEKLINLNGEYQIAALGDPVFFGYPVAGDSINAITEPNLTAVLYIDTLISQQVGDMRFELRGQIETDDDDGNPTFFVLPFNGFADHIESGGDYPGYDRWESDISILLVEEGFYSITVTATGGGVILDPSVEVFEIFRPMQGIPLTGDIDVISPISGQEFSITDTMNIQVETAPEDSEAYAVVAEIHHNNAGLILETVLALDGNQHSILVDFDEHIVGDDGSGGTDLDSIFFTGDYNIQFYLASRDDPNADRIAKDRIAFSIFDEEPEPVYEIIPNSPLPDSIVEGNDLALNFTTSFEADNFNFVLVKDGDTTEGIDHVIDLVAGGTSWQYSVSAENNGLSNGRYILSASVDNIEGATVNLEPFTFYWEITEDEVEPNLISYQPPGGQLGLGGVLVASSNILDIDFILRGVAGMENAYYLEHNLVDCSSEIFFTSEMRELMELAGHDYCFYSTISSDVATEIVNGNYNFYIEYITTGFTSSSTPVLLTYFNELSLDEDLFGTLEIDSAFAGESSIEITFADQIYEGVFFLENIEDQTLYNFDNIAFSLQNNYYVALEFSRISIPIGTYKIYFKTFIDGEAKWTNHLPYFFKVDVDESKFIPENEEELSEPGSYRIYRLVDEKSGDFDLLIASNLSSDSLEVELKHLDSEEVFSFIVEQSSWAAMDALGVAHGLITDVPFAYIREGVDSTLLPNGSYSLSIGNTPVASLVVRINNRTEDENEDNEEEQNDSEESDDHSIAEDIVIDYYSTCIEQGISDEETCMWFRATMDLLDQTCIEQGIYEDVACEDYLFRIETDLECQANNVIDREECKNYLLEKYGGQVDCQLDDMNLCNSILRNEYLNRLVSGQRLSNNINQAVDSLLGKNISTQELSDSLESRGIDSLEVLPLPPSNSTKVLVAKAQKEIVLEEKDKLTILNQAVIILDADGDGLSDDLEKYYGTEVNNSDTDGDGYSDGEEISNGYDPLGPGKLIKERTDFDKVTLDDEKIIEQPKVKSNKIDRVMRVTDVDTSEEELKLTGKAEANSWVNLYLYSGLPLVMTTKTDASGNWSYDIKNSLTDGHHRVFVTVNDDTGKIVKQSRPISFLIKEAKAVTADDYFDEASSSTAVNNLFIYYILGGAFLVFLALGAIIYLHKGKNQNLEI
ncbi:MAG: hypothetical protein HOD06_01385 [Candidatus Komeilibacteria bacterium]|jgi:hypothetical protein|nr:hypothetical protein [Candidatus Komeilibacteria bacterium]